MPRLNIILPQAQSDQRFLPQDLAETLLNIEIGPDRVLRSVTGPTLYEPKHLAAWSGGPADLGAPQAIHHTVVMGSVELLLVAAGGNIYRHHEGKKGWQVIAANIASDAQGQYPPQFLTAGDRVLFCDGRSAPLAIDVNYNVMPLGFTSIPSAPIVNGPKDPPHNVRDVRAMATSGYAMPGDLGTPGDRLSGNDSGTLRTSIAMHTVWESFQGDLSAPSPPSTVVTFGPLKAYPTSESSSGNMRGLGLEIGDLQRGIAARFSGSVPDHVRYVHAMQTPDINNESATPRRAFTFSAAGGSIHTGKATADLGEPMKYTRPVPTFHCMVLFNGALFVAQGAQVFKSDGGFFGTFTEGHTAIPDSRGREVTALFAFDNRCLAFTAGSVTDVSDIGNPQTITTSAGCVGPKALCVVPGVGLLFLGVNGFYLFDGASVKPAQVGIERTMSRRINKSLMSRAVAWFDPESGDARVALPEIGSQYNKLVLCFNPVGGWREMRLGLHIADVTVTESARPLQLALGDDFGTRSGQYTSVDVYVLDRESPTYTPVSRVSRLVSATFAFNATTTQAGRLQHILIGFIETSETASMTVKIRVDFADAYELSTTVPLVDVPGTDEIEEGVGRTGAWDSVVVNTGAVVPRRRLAWRKFAANINNIRRFQIVLECAYPALMEIAMIVVDFTPADDDVARIPFATDA